MTLYVHNCANLGDVLGVQLEGRQCTGLLLSSESHEKADLRGHLWNVLPRQTTAHIGADVALAMKRMRANYAT